MYSTLRVADVVARLPKPEPLGVSSPPPYDPQEGRTARVGLAVESMRRHMSDEGWQLFAGLKEAGYTLWGHNLPVSDHVEGMPRTVETTDVERILHYSCAGTVVVQDKREWDVPGGRDFRDPAARFQNVYRLLDPRVFKLTVLKDAHQRPAYHKASADEMGCNGWVIYYHPVIVKRLAPYVRLEHCIRTHHSVDAAAVPSYTADGRSGCLLSGAVSGAYPLRARLVEGVSRLPQTVWIPHPGYHRNGSDTPMFLKTLSRFKVAICTASIYGYALRKLVEATACGCVVITDLPVDEVMHGIDANLVRVPTGAPVRLVADVVANALVRYDPALQEWFAGEAKRVYNHVSVGKRLADDVEALRLRYNGDGKQVRHEAGRGHHPDEERSVRPGEAAAADRGDD